LSRPIFGVRQHSSAPCSNNPISAFRIAAAQAAPGKAPNQKHMTAGLSAGRQQFEPQQIALLIWIPRIYKRAGIAALVL
jgi:hypothetical protein